MVCRDARGERLNPDALQRLVSVRMPFGKYKGRFLADLPIARRLPVVRPINPSAPAVAVSTRRPWLKV